MIMESYRKAKHIIKLAYEEALYSSSYKDSGSKWLSEVAE